MRDFSKINPSVWTSKKFNSLDENGKLFYLYALSSPHSNSAGCYRLPMGYMKNDLNWSEEVISASLDRVCDTLLIAYDREEEIMFCARWFEYNQPTNSKHAFKVASCLEKIPNCDVKRRTLKDLRDFIDARAWKSENILNYIDIQLNQPFKTAPDTLSDTLCHTQDSDKTQTQTIKEKNNKKETAPQIYKGTDGKEYTIEEITEMFWTNFPRVGRTIKGKGQLQTQLLKILNTKGQTDESRTKQIKEIAVAIQSFRRYCEQTGEKQPDPWRWLKNGGHLESYDFGTPATGDSHGSRGASENSLKDRVVRTSGFVETLFDE